MSLPSPANCPSMQHPSTTTPQPPGMPPVDAVSRVMQTQLQSHPRCMQTILHFLSVHDRILLRIVAPFLSDLVRDPTLWSHVVYVHDGMQSSERIAPPTTPFPCTCTFPPTGVAAVASTSAAGVPSSSHHLPPDAPPASNANPPVSIRPLLPPRWLRSLLHGLILREIASSEISTALTAFPSIRQLTIDQSDTSVLPDPRVGCTIESNFSVLRLESLTFEPITNTLIESLFVIPDTSERPFGILSQCETLTQLTICNTAAVDVKTFFVIMTALARGHWTKLRGFTCFQPLPRSRDARKQALEQCAKVFTQQCMPVLQHLDIKWQFESEEEMNQFHEQLAGLPQLTEIRTNSLLVKPSAGLVNDRLILPEQLKRDIVLPTFAMPPKLTRLVCTNTFLWSGIPSARQLTTLILTSQPGTMRKSIDLFTMIGHHNLPNLAKLSVESCDESIIDDAGVDHHADHDRVLELMSSMTSLTSLHSSIVVHDETRWNSFNWFCHLYRFVSLKNLAFLTITSPHTYRTVPLPLPPGIKLTSNQQQQQQQHALYSNGGGINLVEHNNNLKAESVAALAAQVAVVAGTDFIVVPPPPEWLNADGFRTIESKHNKKEEEEIHVFGLPDQPTIIYLDAHKFREGGNNSTQLIKADQSNVMDIDSSSSSSNISSSNSISSSSTTTTTKNLPTGIFTTVMTQLCMVTMLSHLMILERGLMMRVSRHFYHSVLHSALWKNVNFHATKESGSMLPSSPVCEFIGGLDVSSSTGYDRILSLPSLRRLTLETLPNWDIRERAIYTALTALRLESLSLNLYIQTQPDKKDPFVRMFGAILGLSQVWPPQVKKKGDLMTDPSLSTTTTKDFMQQSGVAEPIIWSYVDSLRRANFRIQWNRNTKLCDRMVERVWSYVHTLKLHYQPFEDYTFGLDGVGAAGSSIPFEDVLIESGRVMPNLTHFMIEFVPANNFSFPLKRIFAALAKANTITTMRHALRRSFHSSFGDSNKQQHAGDMMVESYPPSLTSLMIEAGGVAWQSISQLRSLTVLRFSSIENLPPSPVELFELIGAHRMPHLATLSVASPTFTSPDEASCQRDAAIVVDYMSKMTALTQLHSWAVGASTDSKTTFNWFAHAYAFPNLKHMEYGQRAHTFGLGGQIVPPYDALWQHTLMELPKGTADPSSASAATSPSASLPSLSYPSFSDVAQSHPNLLPPFYNPSSPHHLPPSYSHPPPSSYHVFVPVTVSRSNITETIHNICLQEEYMHLSQEELRIVQQRAVEENGGAELQFHDNRIVPHTPVDVNGLITTVPEETFTLKALSGSRSIVPTGLASFGARSAAAPVTTSNYPSAMSSNSSNLFSFGNNVASPFAGFNSSGPPGTALINNHYQVAPTPLSFASTKVHKSVRTDISTFGPPVLAALPPSTFSAAASEGASSNPFAASTSTLPTAAPAVAATTLALTTSAAMSASAFATSAPTSTTTSASSAPSTTPFVFQFGAKPFVPSTPPPLANVFTLASASLTSSITPTAPFATTTSTILSSSVQTTSNTTAATSMLSSASTLNSTRFTPFAFQFPRTTSPTSTIVSPPAATFTASSSSSSSSSSSPFSTSAFASTSTSTATPISPFTFASLYSSTASSSSSTSSSLTASPASSEPAASFIFQFGSKPVSTASASVSSSATLPSAFGAAFSSSASSQLSSSATSSSSL